jgi:predicted RNA methylase
MGVDMGAMKAIAMDIESTMLNASLILAKAITEEGDFELLEKTAREVREQMQTVVDLFEMVR